MLTYNQIRFDVVIKYEPFSYLKFLLNYLNTIRGILPKLEMKIKWTATYLDFTRVTYATRRSINLYINNVKFLLLKM